MTTFKVSYKWHEFYKGKKSMLWHKSFILISGSTVEDVESKFNQISAIHTDTTIISIESL